MRKGIQFLVVLFLLCSVVISSFAPSVDIEHDEDTGTYYINTYIGSKLERKLLLIDTLANGTAIDYDVQNSKDSNVHNDKPGTIIHAFGSFEGNYTEDNICLDQQEDTCVDEFTFLEVDWFNYKIQSGIKMGGVIPFNRYGFPNNSSLQLVKSLLNEVIFWNPTIQFDFNLPSDMIPQEYDVTPSKITFNGIEPANILYASDNNHGIVNHNNTLDSSTWTFNIHDVLWNDYTIFKTYEKESKKKQQCQVSIATASNYIKMPIGDFQQLEIHMGRKNSDFKSNGTSISAPKPCSHYNMNNLTLIIDDLYYVIPDTFYKRTSGGRCEILVQPNQQMASESNDGYILGQPFLRAFMLIFNYEKNTIGFANKITNYGAEILGNQAPGPRRSYFHPIDEKEEDKDIIPVDDKGTPTDNYEPPKPWQPTPNDSGNGQSNPKTTITIFIWTLVLLLVGFLCYLRYQKKKSKQRMAAKNQDLEYDDSKDPPLLYRQQNSKDNENQNGQKNKIEEQAKSLAVNETLDESMDLTLDYEEEEQVGVVNEQEKEYEDATENQIDTKK